MKTTNAVIAGIVACFVTVAICSTVLFAVDAQSAGDFLTPLLGFAGTTFALVAGLATVARKQAETDEKVTFLANGGMDSKVRAAVADLLPDHLIKQDPETQAQLEVDRDIRDAGPGGTGTP
ncbi:hypothetical protein RB608_12005 [Nocardioides sp. LHD-245]|uniref:hypothetical protein n=1 Tax=Nocardioides sp. LHD-245 TaxID=3051387 RepID=UPI0027DFE7DF|nr:hypothetical protein [Nocardioides sp. LHD-245]